MNIERESAESYVYREIKNAILSRDLQPNYQVVESTVAQQLGVSRTPIRAALKQLAYEGFVDIIQNKGSYIHQPTYDEVNEVFECKKLIETEAAKIAAVNATDEDLKEIEGFIAEELQTHITKDYNHFLNINSRFHMKMAYLSGNRYYIKFIEELITKSNIYLIFYDPISLFTPEKSTSLPEHKQILIALKEHNPEKVAQAVKVHIDSTYQHLNLFSLKKENKFL